MLDSTPPNVLEEKIDLKKTKCVIYYQLEDNFNLIHVY